MSCGNGNSRGAEMLWQPMHQKRHVRERKENSDSTHTWYRTRMDMTIRTRRRDPAAGRKIADQARKCCGRKRGDRIQTRRGITLGVNSDDCESLLAQRQIPKSGLSFLTRRSSDLSWMTLQGLKIGLMN